MNDNQDKDRVIVKIENIQSANAYGKGQNFFEKELEHAIGLIGELLKTKENQRSKTDRTQCGQKETPEEDNHFHQHNTIAVLGPRGVGKTSFMLSLQERVQEDKELKEKVVWLPNLDPTRMEENETFLVTVVANILKKIKKYSKDKLEHDVREKLESLSHDFAVLAPLQVHEEQWKDLVGDPDSFAYEVLNKAHSGLSLARSFHEFLDKCLKQVFCAQAFIQPIDDVDTAIRQGWPILETLRKYLATPYMITIFSGDIDLYETLVRKQQMDKLTHLLESEYKISEYKITEDVSKIKRQISQLTEQYLAKVIPSHLRIRLTPVVEHIMEAATNDHELIYLSTEDNPLSEIYADFSKDLFGYPKQDRGKNIPLLKSPYARLLPFISRDLVQLFKILKPFKDNTEEGKKEKTPEALAQVLNAALYNGNITIDDLLLLRQGRHLEWLANHCLETRQQVQEFWRLHPRYDDEEWNQRALLLQAFLFQSWKAQEKTRTELLYPHGPMSYGIKVLLPCWIADTRDLIGDKLAEMKRILKVDNTERHVHMATRSLAYGLSDNQENWSSYGLGYVRVDNTIEIEWKNSLGWFGHRVYRPNSGLASYVHVLLALARLVDVLKEGFSCDANQLENLFNLFIQDRVHYLHSHPKTNISPPGNDKIIGFDNAEFNNKILSKESMLNWIRGMRLIKPEQLLPPPIIARIWVRFMSNLYYIRTDIESQTPSNNLGKIIGCWIKAFLIAILIEEVVFRRGDPEFNIDVKSIRLGDDNTFTGILSRSELYQDPDLICYTKAWMSCPLFLEFIGNDIKDFRENLFSNDTDELPWLDIINKYVETNR